MNSRKALNVLNDWKNDWNERQYYVSAAIERLEPLERLERLERLEPDFKTGHSKIHDLTLEASTKRKCPAIDEQCACRSAAGPLDTQPRRTRRNQSDEDSEYNANQKP